MNTVISTNNLQKLLIVLCTFALVSCGALNTSLKKSDLAVETKASESVFLEPVGPDKRIVFVSVRNTSDKDLNIKSQIINRLLDSGYRVTDHPDEAYFSLQANVLKVGKDDLKAADSHLEAGFSGAVVGGALASNASAEGAIVGALVGIFADSLVEDTLFTMVTDLQIRERPRSNEVVTQQQSADSTQGDNANISETTEITSVDWKTYRTRIVSTANQSNLTFEEALPGLENGLVRSIAGLFAE